MITNCPVCGLELDAKTWVGGRCPRCKLGRMFAGLDQAISTGKAINTDAIRDEPPVYDCRVHGQHMSVAHAQVEGQQANTYCLLCVVELLDKLIGQCQLVNSEE